MNSFFFVDLTAELICSISSNAENYTSILKKTKDRVNKIEIRNQEQCDKESEIFSRNSRMLREICDHENREVVN